MKTCFCPLGFRTVKPSQGFSGPKIVAVMESEAVFMFFSMSFNMTRARQLLETFAPTGEGL